MFAKIKAEIEALLANVDGEVHRKLTALLALVTTTEQELEAAVANAEPGVKTAVEAALEKMLAEIAALGHA